MSRRRLPWLLVVITVGASASAWAADEPAATSESTDGGVASPEQPAPETTGAPDAGVAPAPARKKVREEPAAIDATPTHWPLVPYKPGRPLPPLAERHDPRLLDNTVDGKVWTQTLYTVSQPLGVEWGYGQVGAQVDADRLGGLPIGLHVDGFFQQRLYQRPLRIGLRRGWFYFDNEPYDGLGGTRHPRYFTYDRLTEANLSVRTKYVDAVVGRSIVPQTLQAYVDGAVVSVAIGRYMRAGGFAGLMPDIWHPRMWLDSDYRSLANFFPSDRDETFSADPLQDDVQLFSRLPSRAINNVLNGQTVFNLRYMTAGGWFSARLDRFTSDTSTQLILFNPTHRYSAVGNGLQPDPSVLGIGDTPFRIVDAFFINNVMTWRPLVPLNFHLRSSWDAWGAVRALDARRVDPSGNLLSALQEPVQYLDPVFDNSLGLRELMADATFRGDWPFGLNIQFHHFQSQLTATSYAAYQRDLLQPSTYDQFQAARNNPGAKPGPYMPVIVESKVFNNTRLGTVQRERLRASGWVSPLGFLNPDSSAQLYGDMYLEWRRDFPRPHPETGVACTLEENNAPVRHYTRRGCGSDAYARQDDHVRLGASAGVRDPTLYDNINYDLGVTVVDSWHNRYAMVRGRVGAQAFSSLFLDMGFTYELSLNQRYYTSTVNYDVTGAQRAAAGYYPRQATGQAFVFDASIMYRVALGMEFDINYLLFYEEAPVVQDYILSNNTSPAGIIGYIPRDQHQAQQLFLLRAIYRL